VTGLEHRVRLLIPEQQIGQSARIEFYASTASDGTPIAGDRIELVQDVFRLVAVGDSVMWGNGLLEPDKFSSLVADVIEQRLGIRVLRRVLAVSGAQIMPSPADGLCEFNCSGEVPKAYTSIMDQVDRIEDPESVELILLNGCLNDVGLFTILGDELTDDVLAQSIRDACEGNMTLLLEKVRAVAPSAHVVVSGFYPMVSEATDLGTLLNYGDVQEVPSRSETATEFLNVAISHSTLFNDLSRESLIAAIDAVNAAEEGPPMIAFADPAFGPERALFAPESWVWGVRPDTGQTESLEDLPFLPEDPRFRFRLSACGEEGVMANLLICLFGSVGHPNVEGAKAYADAIMPRLEELGVLPADGESK
jgi:hypothetical protein